MENCKLIDIRIHLPDQDQVDSISFQQQCYEGIPRTEEDLLTGKSPLCSAHVCRSDANKQFVFVGKDHGVTSDSSRPSCPYPQCTFETISRGAMNTNCCQESPKPEVGLEERDKDLASSNNCSSRLYSPNCEHTPCTKYKGLSLTLDPLLASCILCEMRCSDTYRLMFLKNLCDRFCSLQRRKKAAVQTCGIRLKIKLTETNMFKMEPDIRWSLKILPLWLMRISMEDTFSWLSTLGGAYSALGDDFIHFAEKAGHVSVQQMKLAIQIGDPFLLARCRVYIAQSLMQKGFIQQAMFIIRKQYHFALSLGDSTDQRLVNMCRGVWSIMQYLHRHKKKHKKKRKKNSVGLHQLPHQSQTKTK